MVFLTKNFINKNPMFIRYSNQIPFESNEVKLKYGEWKYLQNKNSSTCIVSYGYVYLV